MRGSRRSATSRLAALAVAALALSACPRGGATTTTSVNEAAPTTAAQTTQAQAASPQAAPETVVTPPAPRGQCLEHALAVPAIPGQPRPGHETAYDPQAIVDAIAERLQPRADQALTPGTGYSEAQNAQGQLSTSCSGTHCAWQYVPSASYRLERVALHGTSTEAALLADDCGRPGALLSRAALRQGNESGWMEGRFEPPVTVEAERPYWLWHSPGQCSVVASGASQVYWCGDVGTAPESWSGPWRSFAWTARLSGTIQ